jgi:uncharacterized protein (TIGR03437 family)
VSSFCRIIVIFACYRQSPFSVNKASATLYGTGLQAAGAAGITATVGGVNAPVVSVGSASIAGVDQVIIQLSASLAGSGNVNVQLTAAGVAANPVQITIQ